MTELFVWSKSKSILTFFTKCFEGLLIQQRFNETAATRIQKMKRLFNSLANKASYWRTTSAYACILYRVFACFAPWGRPRGSNKCQRSCTVTRAVNDDVKRGQPCYKWEIMHRNHFSRDSVATEKNNSINDQPPSKSSINPQSNMD